MKLSILICSIPSRRKFLSRLDSLIQWQKSPFPNDVEVIVNSDNASIGSKRNTLLSQAKGEYCAFIDDDDLVAPNYIELVLKAIETKPDVVGMNLIMTTDGLRAERSFHLLEVENWSEIQEPYIPGHKMYFRCPNHLNPVKTEIARKVGFPDISMGEDRDYSLRLREHLHTQVVIHQPIYFYLFRTNK